MEQVAVNHGDGIAEIRTQFVDEFLREQLNIQLPSCFQEFYDFPKQCGWCVREDFTLAPSSERGEEEPSLVFFLQAWLFFGLILTVVQQDNEPLLTFDDLRIGNQLSTKHLHAAIDKWTSWENGHRDGSRFRMIQVGWVLDLAREVIRKRYAYDYVTDANPSDEGDLHDRCILVVMCLGETLSAARTRIVEQNEISTLGWDGDNQAGWGPPRYIFNEMERKGWCPRTIEILRGQVSSNAIMLVAAYQAYKDSSRTAENHKKAGCTKDECKVSPLDKEGNYRNGHMEKCSADVCSSCGPEMEEVIAVLRKEDNIIPILQFYSGNGKRSFNVREFNPETDTTMEFVTISHVWSDGWGNMKDNKLNRCQIDFIRRQIRKATGRTDALFWMDTLVVPVANDAVDLRKKAIRQIFDVFSSSTHTIILDNGLFKMDRGGTDKPAEAAMKIFASVWMRRLWTLQEAVLSRSILIPFEEEVEQQTNNLLNFDDIEDELERFMKTSSAGITKVIKDQLSRMIMGEERRRHRNNKREIFSEKDRPTTVANTYRAARWRVSYDKSPVQQTY